MMKFYYLFFFIILLKYGVEGRPYQDEDSQKVNQLFVHSLTGKTFAVDVNPESASVKQVKEAIQNTIGLPTNIQRLVSGGKLLDDRFQLSDYNIKSDSTVFLVLKLAGGMQLHVKSWICNSFDINADPSDTVSNLKEKIAQNYRVPVDRQRLMFNNLIMDDWRTLSDYNLSHGSTIILSTRLRGGQQ